MENFDLDLILMRDSNTPGLYHFKFPIELNVILAAGWANKDCKGWVEEISFLWGWRVPKLKMAAPMKSILKHEINFKSVLE